MSDINSSDEAVVGIVVAILLIGLAISITVMINNVYVPQWLEEEEAAHHIMLDNNIYMKTVP